MGRVDSGVLDTFLQGPSPLPVSTATSARGTRRTCAFTCDAGTQAASRSGGGATLRSPPPAGAPSSPCSRLRSSSSSTAQPPRPLPAPQGPPR